MTSGPGLDGCLLEQLDEQLIGLKLKALDVSCSILTLSDDTTIQAETDSKISQGTYDILFHIKTLLSTPTPVTALTITHEAGGIKLPKIAVPAFDGRITEWSIFREQCETAIHSKPYIYLKRREVRVSTAIT